PMPKGNIQPLWDLLEVDFSKDRVQTGRRSQRDRDGVRIYDGDMIIWHNYNPFPKMAMFGLSQHEWVYVGVGSSNPEAFNPKDPISADLQNVLLPFPGAIAPRSSASNTEFTPLLSTGSETGSIALNDVITPNPF